MFATPKSMSDIIAAAMQAKPKVGKVTVSNLLMTFTS
jgi:hypothetical protein